MRNSGWYIPFWRRSKKKGRSDKPDSVEVARSDEQLEAVRQRWIDRYRRTMRALSLMGLSMGSNRGDVQARYNALRGSGRISARDLDDAYRYLQRVLPAQERRKRRSPTRGQQSGVSSDTVARSDDRALYQDEHDDEDGEGSSGAYGWDSSEDTPDRARLPDTSSNSADVSFAPASDVSAGDAVSPAWAAAEDLPPA